MSDRQEVQLDYDVLRAAIEGAEDPDAVRSALRGLLDDVLEGSVSVVEDVLDVKVGDRSVDECHRRFGENVDGIMDELEVREDVDDECSDCLDEIPVVVVGEEILSFSRGDGERARPVRRLNGDSNGETLEGAPRTRYVLTILKEMGVDLKTCELFTAGAIDKNQPILDGTPRLIYVPSLKKAVIVCDESGNGTYVIYECEDPEAFVGVKPAALFKESVKGKVKPIAFNVGYEENWKARVGNALKRDLGDVGLVIDPDAPIEGPLDALYFKDASKVSNDLDNFVSATDGVDDVFELTTSNMYQKVVQLSNNEVVNGARYLELAAKHFGFIKGQNAKGEDAFAIGETLKRLKEVAGCRLRDADYYLDPETVLYDLKEYFVEVFGEDNKDGHVLTDLKMPKRDVEIRCSNGERILVRKYLNHACRIFDLPLDSSDILEILMKVAGYNTSLGIISDPRYSKDPVTIAYDARSISRALKRPLSKMSLRSVRIGTFDFRYNKHVLGAHYLKAIGDSYEVAAEGPRVGADRKTSYAVEKLAWVMFLKEAERIGLDMNGIGCGPVRRLNMRGSILT